MISTSEASRLGKYLFSHHSTLFQLLVIKKAIKCTLAIRKKSHHCSLRSTVFARAPDAVPPSYNVVADVIIVILPGLWGASSLLPAII
jgi:hypothetical protein